MGFGYNYRVKVNEADNPVRTITGKTQFGNSKAIVINGLLAKQLYKFTIEHECASVPGNFSYAQKASTTTLETGKFDV